MFFIRGGIIIFICAYLIESFVLLSINALNWKIEQRETCVAIFFVSYALWAVAYAIFCEVHSDEND